ncbi:GNAT family N-acetyltransferase [Frigidibacter oleivorans]|uniref:GNAT family N-acetyltransferase n=1 Tax=Frigidibacter oleivorans TaxID=2487129 RepID=UPI000F8D8E29|nr:GNAT family N-acetyltransferase [Frigidibacter oleivorans]
MTAASPALTDTPVLRTERLVLRAPEGSDWEAWCAFAMSDRSRHMGGPYSRDTAWRAFGHVIGHWAMRGFGSFVFATPEGTPLGMTGPWYPEGWPERELGWSVWAPGAEGKGLAFEAAAAARVHAFRDLGWTTAVSYIAPANDRSAALALRLGAVEEPGAAFPGDGPCRVFRHPRPEAA